MLKPPKLRVPVDQLPGARKFDRLATQVRFSAPYDWNDNQRFTNSVNHEIPLVARNEPRAVGAERLITHENFIGLRKEARPAATFGVSPDRSNRPRIKITGRQQNQAGMNTGMQPDLAHGR